ncbi:hypothetical protein [Lentzea sp. NBRC 102530]|uniref:hypothetical protein n=1 Tax=Lentzea sp. NBRC 102530 TaxID=3032201 RepID=UPI0024A18D8C|nr:hypothetical protein [Lentzea sp. NBRC 102530]GLY55324.1 hypothetical protein Lesp01_89790 [Lentzea sp. NBRC 102530]
MPMLAAIESGGAAPDNSGSIKSQVQQAQAAMAQHRAAERAMYPFNPNAAATIAANVQRPAPQQQAAPVSKPVTLYQQPQTSRGRMTPGLLGPDDLMPGSDAPGGMPTISRDKLGLPEPMLGGDAPAGKREEKLGKVTDGDNLDLLGRENQRQYGSEQWVKRNITQLVEDIDKDPAITAQRKNVVRQMVELFGKDIHSRVWRTEDIAVNPVLRELTNLSTWSRYRRAVSEWQANKNKLGQETEDNGDGSFNSLITGSFSQKTGTANVPGFMVAKDKNGLLYVTDVDTWINGKISDMKKDPKLAADTITALASIQAYGSDSSSNNAASRVVVGPDGNPEKAFISNEDYTALKNMALLAVNSQTVGNEETLEDFFSSLTAQSQAVVNDPNWEVGSDGGGGGFRRGGGGYGGGYGGGGGGGGGGAVRYTDSEQLGAQVDAIARQRMGRSLTPEERTEFVAYYHQLEEQMTAAYYAGGSTTQLDPEGQAVGWIQSRFGVERGAYQYANMAAQFMKMIGAGGFTGALGG